MAALISAASTGKLSATATPTSQPTMTSPEASNQPETTEKVRGALQKILSSQITILKVTRILKASGIMTKTLGQFLAGNVKGLILEAINKCED